MPTLLRPRALKPGDVVAVAALSGPLRPGEEDFLALGVQTIETMGLRVRVSPLVDPDRRRWWGAATPRETADELNSLLRDPEIRAIFAHTGGRWTLSYLDLVDTEAILADPKPIIGYSDISGLLLALHSRTGLVSLHADLTTPGFGIGWYLSASEQRRAELIDVYARMLMRPEPFGALPPGGTWETWRPGRASGHLVGGLLNRLTRIQATSFALPPEHFDGAILFWEEDNTPTTAVWMDLHVLRQAGVFDRIAGMVVGIPNAVTAGDAGGPAEVRELVLDVVGGYGFPILGQVDFGHACPNLPLPLGVEAEVDATARSLKLLGPAVR